MTLTRRDILVTAAVPVAALACDAMYRVVAPSSRNVGLLAGQQAIDTREFDRRHAAVRAAMNVHGVDCLLVPINENLTYLTNVATIAYGAYLLFPIEGLPTLMINPISYWSARTGRLTQTAYAGGELAQTIRRFFRSGGHRGRFDAGFHLSNQSLVRRGAAYNERRWESSAGSTISRAVAGRS